MAKITVEEGHRLTTYKQAIDCAKLECENARLKEDLTSVQMQLFISGLYIKYSMTEQDKISPNGEIIRAPIAAPVGENVPEATPPIIKYGNEDSPEKTG